MCGIGGILGSSDGLDPAALLSALGHRGPDRSAAFSPSDGSWLCAARLAISDPTPAGNQPMSTEDGALTIVHNGEIYNAAELRDQLRARGHVFRSRADTEVLLYGHREWGEALPARLDGMFAYAVWDARARKLTLARDAIGIKPLWLARPNRRVVFASEVRALLAARAAAASLDETAIADYLATGAIAEPRAIVRGVEALPPGTLAIFSDGGERRVQWFALPDGEAEASAGEAAQAVRACLERAMNGCLEADVPVALLLSGGIDSSALALIAGARRAIRTFHVHLGGKMASRAAELARTLHFSHEEVRAPWDDDAAASMGAHLAAQDQPSVDGANTWLIARAIRAAGLKAAVTGLGADELFLGYPLHRSYVRARSLAGRRFTAPLARAAGSLAHAAVAPFPVEKLLGVAAAGGSPAATHAALRALFPAAQAARLLPGVARAPLWEPEAPSPAGEVSRLELAGYVRNTLLRDADVMGMAHGVELRVPMLERAVVETVLALPPSVKLKAGTQKPILVDAVPELPRDLVAAKKRGFDLPWHRWLLGPLRASVEESLHARSRLGLEPRELARVWRRFLLRRDRPSAMRCWALHALHTWAERRGASR